MLWSFMSWRFRTWSPQDHPLPILLTQGSGGLLKAPRLGSQNLVWAPTITFSRMWTQESYFFLSCSCLYRQDFPPTWLDTRILGYRCGYMNQAWSVIESHSLGHKKDPDMVFGLLVQTCPEKWTVIKESPSFVTEYAWPFAHLTFCSEVKLWDQIRLGSFYFDKLQ